jgi:hypothetical protein
LASVRLLLLLVHHHHLLHHHLLLHLLLHQELLLRGIHGLLLGIETLQVWHEPINSLVSRRYSSTWACCLATVAAGPTRREQIVRPLCWLSSAAVAEVQWCSLMRGYRSQACRQDHLLV